MSKDRVTGESMTDRSGATSVEISGSEKLKLDKVALAERCWKVATVVVLYALLFREELLRLLGQWSTARESHGLLIPAFSLYFLYQDRFRLRKVLSKPSYVGLLIILLSLLGYVYSIYKSLFYPRQLMMISLLGGIVLLLSGWRVLRVVWLPIAYLIFAMPLPSRMYYNITMPMRELASTVAAVLLNAIPEVQCEATGVIIRGIHQGTSFNLNVAEACSGMRLLLAFVALGVAMAYLEYRPIVHRVVLLVSTIPIAIFCNVMRVLLTGIIHIFIGAEYAAGTLHTIMGMVMLGVAFGLYGLLAWIMNRLVVEDDHGDVLLVRNKQEE